MLLWIWLAIIAQVIYAIVAIFDKSLVTSKTVLHPFSYAFYVSILSALSILVFIAGWLPISLPYGIEIPKFSNLIIPSFTVISLSITTGVVMFLALVNLYEGLSKADASDVVPVVSSVGAIGTLILEYLFLDGRYWGLNFLGIMLLILGTFLVSTFRFNKVVVFHTVISGLSFALYYILIKQTFNLAGFDSGFLYTRLGLVFAALLVISIPSYRKRIFRKLRGKKVQKRKAGMYVLILKTFSGLASILTLKAIDMGTVAVVQALAGTQFLVLILASFLFGWYTPVYFGENDLKVKDYVQKVSAAALITLGLYFSFA